MWVRGRRCSNLVGRVGMVLSFAGWVEWTLEWGRGGVWWGEGRRG